MKIHYGNSDGTVDLSSLTQENIVNFNKYFNSFGISLIIQIDNNAVINGADYQSIKYTNITINVPITNTTADIPV